jgi:vacuolar protein sorting-associated protein 13A/C
LKHDGLPFSGDLAIVSRTPSFAGVGASSSMLDVAGHPERAEPEAGKETEFHMILDIHDLGVSIIDHSPEELLFVAIQGANVSYSTGLAGGITR